MVKTGENPEDCLRLIESQLNWGDSSQWTQYDFQKLSDLIEAKTNVLLSVTTLKRLWGRLKYDNLPSVTTLNTLARFAGYHDWRQFVQQQQEDVELRSAPPVTLNNAIPLTKSFGPASTPRKYRARRFTIAGLITFLIVVALVSLTTNKRQESITAQAENQTIAKAPDPADFSFKADKMIGEGVPNSVVFTYNASKAETDSVYIVQTWDITRKTLVAKNGTNHSAIYYYPGYFRTRLIVDGVVVQSHPLQITSGGWLCLAEQDPAPIYFDKKQFIKTDRIEVDADVLKAFGLSLHPKAPKVRFFNQGDLGNLMSDNFLFETTVKNDFNEGAGVCQLVQVLIQCKEDIIIIPLSAAACIGELSLTACGKRIESKEADLSGFGCDLTQWTRLRVETVDSKMTFYVNDRKAYSLTVRNEPTGIVGVQYRFTGLGAVKDTRFIGGGKVHNL